MNTLKNKDEMMRNGASKAHGSAHSRDHAEWSRRDFLSMAGLAGVGAPLLIGGRSVQAMTGSSILSKLADIETDRVLVLLELKGGCDGLSLVVPVTNDLYYSTYRQQLGVAQADTFSLDGDYGMNNHMSAVEGMWNEGKMGVIRNVGYPGASLSHFEEAEKWKSSRVDYNEPTGWIGRTIDYAYPDFESDPPSSPLAVEINWTPTRLMAGPDISMGMTFQNAAQYYSIASTGGIYDPNDVPMTPYGEELSYLREITNFTVRYADSIQAASNAGSNDVSYPSGNLADSLAVVAQLIKGGLGAKVYAVTLQGFDTHDSQENYFPGLLQELSGSVEAFYRDLEFTSQEDKVLTMTYSEFGRRIFENASAGTDHGAGSPMLIFGGDSQINGGLHGEAPDLENTDNRGNIIPSTDFRSVYGTLMNSWLGIDCNPVNGILGFEYDDLNLVQERLPGTLSCSLPVELSSFEALQDDDGSVILTWTTLSELNNQGFSVEQLAMTGTFQVWTEIGFVEGNGTSVNENNYSFTAKLAEPGLYRFRLKQIDFSGVYQYTNRVEIEVELPQGVAFTEFYPNPVASKGRYNLLVQSRQEVSVEMFNQNGQLVRKVFSGTVLPKEPVRLQIKVADLSAGNYILVTRGQNFLSSRKIVVINL